MAISINDCANVGSSLAYLGKQHLDPKASVKYITELDGLVDYLPNYSLVIIEEEPEFEGALFQLQPDGTWQEWNPSGVGALISDDNISDSEVYSSQKVENTYRKISESLSKTEIEEGYGTLEQQASNTRAIAALETKMQDVSKAVKYLGNVATKGDLLSLENPEQGWWYIVDADETRDFESCNYIYNGSEWIFNGVREITLRNFTTNPINLGSTDEDGVFHTEVTGKIKLENIDFGVGTGLDASSISYNDNEEFDTVADALNKLLYVALTLNLTSTTPLTNEVGSVIANPVFNWKYNKSVVSQNINGEALDKALRTYTYNGNITSNKIIKLIANDGTKDFSTSITFSFLWSSYIGTAPTPSTINNEFILGLGQKKLQNSCTGSYTVNCADGQYIWFCFPTELCSGLTPNVNGFSGGFELVTTMQVENVFNSTHQYNIYKSDNHSLGSTVVVWSK